MGARAANTTRRKVRLECMLAEPSGDPESRIGIRRLRKRMLWFFRFLASRPPVPLPAPVILAAWRCTPDWEPLPKKSLKATGRARQKEVSSRAKALEVEYSSARRGPSSTLYFVKYFEVWTTGWSTVVDERVDHLQYPPSAPSESAALHSDGESGSKN